MAAALIFGFVDSLQQKLSIPNTPIPSEFPSMAPIATIVVVAGLVGRRVCRPPSANPEGSGMVSMTRADLSPPPLGPWRTPTPPIALSGRRRNRDETGAVHVGANNENAAYPVGNCAEASVIAMVMAGYQIAEIAVAGADGVMFAHPAGLRHESANSADGHACACLRADGPMRRFTLAELLKFRARQSQLTIWPQYRSAIPAGYSVIDLHLHRQGQRT